MGGGRTAPPATLSGVGDCVICEKHTRADTDPPLSRHAARVLVDQGRRVAGRAARRRERDRRADRASARGQLRSGADLTHGPSPRRARRGRARAYAVGVIHEPHPPRHPTSADEELLEAETSAILSELSDERAARAHRGRAPRRGSRALRTSARRSRSSARRARRATTRSTRGRARSPGGSARPASRSSPAAAPGIMEAANRGARTPARPRSGSTSSCRTSRR